MFYLQMRGHDQLYGLIKMEIILELECGLDVNFEPDFRMPNHSDQTKVQWEFWDTSNPQHLDDVFVEFPSEEPLFKPNVGLENLRLLCRHD